MAELVRFHVKAQTAAEIKMRSRLSICSLTSAKPEKKFDYKFFKILAKKHMHDLTVRPINWRGCVNA